MGKISFYFLKLFQFWISSRCKYLYLIDIGKAKATKIWARRERNFYSMNIVLTAEPFRAIGKAWPRQRFDYALRWIFLLTAGSKFFESHRWCHWFLPPLWGSYHHVFPKKCRALYHISPHISYERRRMVASLLWDRREFFLVLPIPSTMFRNLLRKWRSPWGLSQLWGS